MNSKTNGESGTNGTNGATENAIEYITRVDWRHSRLGLQRVEELLNRLGNPQDKLQFVHIAGTNGKSTVSCMVASVLTQAGYKAGLFTSPYVNCFNERMQINGRMIRDEELAEVTEKVRAFADEMEDHPTEFELVTVVAFEWFMQQGCDIVALEVGLGGRLDATNVIQTPQLAFVATIALDHTDILGDTLEKIAAEKAGVIKPGGDVLLYPQQPEVRAVFAEACRREGARLHDVDLAPLQVGESSFAGQHFAYGERRQLFTPLLGPYQPKNAAMVIQAAAILRQKGWKISEENLRRGLAEARWPARFELMQAAPAFIVDGGHNPQCVQMLLEGLDRYFPQKQVIFIVGVMADKDYDTMFGMVQSRARRALCVAPNNPRALPAEELAAALRGMGFAEVQACPSVPAAVQAALAGAQSDDVICAFGSFYMAGDIRACFGK